MSTSGWISEGNLVSWSWTPSVMYEMNILVSFVKISGASHFSLFFFPSFCLNLLVFTQFACYIGFFLFVEQIIWINRTYYLWDKLIENKQDKFLFWNMKIAWIKCTINLKISSTKKKISYNNHPWKWTEAISYIASSLYFKHQTP